MQRLKSSLKNEDKKLKSGIRGNILLLQGILQSKRVFYLLNRNAPNKQ
nr:MAG TPA: hypothetical protein [Caudoviricetes sp.]DAX38665.1 MAG TPA: hypothetical protein [Caudoviricetes sp.]